MKFSKLLLLFAFLMGASSGLWAQDQVVQIKKKRTLWIPKLDLFWAGVVVAEQFPTFFPLELELHLPSARLSVNAIFSPWGERYNASQTTKVKESSIIGGVGLRYYAFATQGTPGQGFFFEPQFFYRWHKSTSTFQLNSATEPEVTVTEANETAFMGAIGYQHHFFERLYVQGRLSVGYTDTQILSGLRSDNLLFLPWVGVGLGF